MAELFTNCTVYTSGSRNEVITNAAILVDGDKIAGLGSASALEREHPHAKRHDMHGALVVPGFICAHHHFYSSLARGMKIPGEPAANFVQILERLWWKLDRALNLDDVAVSADLALMECIRHGTTTIIDHHASPGARDGSLDVIEESVRRAGLRASLCYEVSDRNVHGAGLSENERFIKKIGKGDGQISAMMGLHASFTVANDTLEQAVGIARDGNVGCHVHVAEDASDREDSHHKHGVSTVARLLQAGAGGHDSLFIHCIHVDAAEIDMLASSKTTVITNPESNMNNAVGVTPVLQMLRAGVLVGLGTDGMSSDMVAQIRATYLLQRLTNRDPRVAFVEAPGLALTNNPMIAERQLGLPLGELSIGKPADFAALRYNPPTPLAGENFLGHLIFGMPGTTVDTTVCRGRILMQNGQLTTMDEQRLTARSCELARAMWKRLETMP